MKYEYNKKLLLINTDEKLGFTNKLLLKNSIKDDYIASLEAEVAKLEKAVDKAADILTNEGIWVDDTGIISLEKWRKYLLEERNDD